MQLAHRSGRGEAGAGWAPTTRGLVLALALAIASSQGLAAQTDSAPPDMTCWRGQPLPACGGFFLVEAQGLLPLTRQTQERYAPYQEGFEARLEWNVGYMVNLGPRWAVGGAISVGPGADDVLTGLRARARRWLGPQLSLELEGGLLRTQAGFGSDASGFTAGARFNVADKGSLFVRWDGVEVPAFDQPGLPFSDPGGFKQAVYVGAGTGSSWAVGSTAALGLGYLVLIALLIGSYD